MLIKLTDKEYQVNNNEFEHQPHERYTNLLIRKDISAEVGYSNFIINDKSLENQPIKLMSKLTKSILQSIDYEKIAKVRIDNFW